MKVSKLYPVKHVKLVLNIYSMLLVQTGVASSKQVGQWSGSERTAGHILSSPNLPSVPEGGTVDDLGSVAPPVQPGIQPAQRRLPLHAPFGLPAADCLLCRLRWRVQ